MIAYSYKAQTVTLTDDKDPTRTAVISMKGKTQAQLDAEIVAFDPSLPPAVPDQVGPVKLLAAMVATSTITQAKADLIVARLKA